MAALSRFNRMETAAALEMISRCCGSTRWAERMVAARPFCSLDQLSAAADTHWRAMKRRDLLEAFRSHPRIGRPDSAGGARTNTHRMAAAEQSGAAQASPRTLELLAQYNHAYEKKFGFIFIVCATGRSAEQMLRLLRARIGNDRNSEIANAAGEQRKITQLRIHKLFARAA